MSGHRYIKVAVLLLLGAAVWLGWSYLMFISGFGTVQVRIDSGDRRVRSGPFSSLEGSARGRDLIMAAAKELGIPARWHAAPRAPSNADGGRSFIYNGIAFWLEQEPRLGRIMLQDAASYFGRPGLHDGWPPSLAFCFGLSWDETRQLVELNETVYGDPEVLRIQLGEIGYVPDAGGRLAQLLNAESPK
jgi:hypothetical protein